MVQDVRAGSGQPVDAGEAMRLATALGQTLDQLLIEKVGPEKLRELNVSGDLSDHWNKSLELFNILLERWPRELAARALIDMAESSNRLLAYIAERWRSAPPSGFVVVDGIAPHTPAIAGLLPPVPLIPLAFVVHPHPY